MSSALGEYKAFQELIRERNLEYTMNAAATTAATQQEFSHYARLAMWIDRVR